MEMSPAAMAGSALALAVAWHCCAAAAAAPASAAHGHGHFGDESAEAKDAKHAHGHDADGNCIDDGHGHGHSHGHGHGHGKKEPPTDEKNNKKKKTPYVEEIVPEARKAALTGRIDAWVGGGKASPLHFEASLSAGERKFVHALCESRVSDFPLFPSIVSLLFLCFPLFSSIVHLFLPQGCVSERLLGGSQGSELSSKSEGKGPERHVVVFDAPVEEGAISYKT